MFKHYESEQDAQAARMDKEHPKTNRPRAQVALGQSRRGQSGFVYRMKNMTVYIPLQTMWVNSVRQRHEQHARPRLSQMWIKVRSIDNSSRLCQQARNGLLQTHRGIGRLRISHAGGLGGADQYFDSYAAVERRHHRAISLARGGIGS